MNAADRLKALMAAKKATASTAKAQVTSEEAPHVTGNVPSNTNTSVDTGSGMGNSVSETPSSSSNNGVITSPDIPDTSATAKYDGVVTTDNEAIMENLLQLEDMLLKDAPEFRTVLRDIHRKLRNDPEIVTVLSPEEVALVVKGLAKHANTEVIAPAKVKSAKKAAKNVNASDL